MPAEDWKYVENQFEVVTRRSRPAMNRLLSDHVAKLTTAAGQPGANPELAALLTRITPVAATWAAAYTQWQNDTAIYNGATTTLEGLLENLASAPGPEQTSKIENWDARMRAAVPRGSGIYRTLLPGGRAPFTEGRRDDIVQAVKTLGERLALQTTKPELLALGLEVTAYWTSLKTARDTQQGHEGTVDTAAKAIEPARLAAATKLYGNLGRLMFIHEDNPAAVAGYFDLDTLREPARSDSGSGAGTASAGGQG